MPEATLKHPISPSTYWYRSLSDFVAWLRQQPDFGFTDQLAVLNLLSPGEPPTMRELMILVRYYVKAVKREIELDHDLDMLVPEVSRLTAPQFLQWMRGKGAIEEDLDWLMNPSPFDDRSPYYSQVMAGRLPVMRDAIRLCKMWIMVAYLLPAGVPLTQWLNSYFICDDYDSHNVRYRSPREYFSYNEDVIVYASNAWQAHREGETDEVKLRGVGLIPVSYDEANSSNP